MFSLFKSRKQVFASPSFLSSAEQIIADVSANNLIRLQEELDRGEITSEEAKEKRARFERVCQTIRNLPR